MKDELLSLGSPLQYNTKRTKRCSIVCDQASLEELLQHYFAQMFCDGKGREDLCRKISFMRKLVSCIFWRNMSSVKAIPKKSCLFTMNEWIRRTLILEKLAVENLQQVILAENLLWLNS